jgi:CSLREA domain-containing protein
VRKQAPGVLLAALLALALAAPAGAAPFLVTKTADTADGVCDSDCSLREAITVTKASNAADEISFDPSAWGVIKLQSALPQVGASDAIVGPLDGGHPIVEIDAGAPGVQPGVSLGSGALLKRVSVTGADGSGVLLNGDGGTVVGTMVGVDPSGACKPNDIGVDVGGDNNALGNAPGSGNLIGCNGIGVQGRDTASNLWLRRNTIAGNATGVSSAGQPTSSWATPASGSSSPATTPARASSRTTSSGRPRQSTAPPSIRTAAGRSSSGRARRSTSCPAT